MFPETNPAPGFAKNPEHEVRTRAYRGTVIVEADGTEIARSNSALVLIETNHPPAYYLPIGDVKQEFLRNSSRVTRCPFKGKARYWNVRVGNHEIDNAVWAYEMPYDEVLELAGLVAFYETKVKVTVEPEPVI